MKKLELNNEQATLLISLVRDGWGTLFEVKKDFPNLASINKAEEQAYDLLQCIKQQIADQTK